MTELYKKYRPKKFSQLCGNKSVVKSLIRMCKNKEIPHALMFTGESGCGKTTAARILKSKLKCVGSITTGEGDYKEINASEDRGIKMIRSIGDTIRASPMFGDSRMWVIDEAQGLTAAAQNAVLKFLEDPPDHAYLIFCTTDPSKIIKTIHSRCTQFKMAAPTEEELVKLMTDILKKEKVTVDPKVLKRICAVTDNAPRKALVILDQVYKLDTEQEMLDAVQKSESRQQAIDLARKLIAPKPKWAQVKELVRNIEEEPETVRRIMLTYASSVCLNGGPLSQRASVLYDAFRDIFVTGKADLVFACYAVCAGT